MDIVYIGILLLIGYYFIFIIMILRKRIYKRLIYYIIVSRVYEYGYFFSEVRNFKEYYVGCDEVYGERSSFGEVYVIWDFVDKFYWYVDYFCLGIVIDKCYDTVFNLGIGKYWVSGGFLIFFEGFFKYF